MSNPFYNPEHFGLTTVGQLDYSSGAYEFDLTAVWVDAAKQLYYSDDSGCSCPTPFEDARGVLDLTKASIAELQIHLRARREAAYGDYVSDSNIVDLVNAARKAIA